VGRRADAGAGFGGGELQVADEGPPAVHVAAEHVDRAEEAHDERAGGLLEDLGRRPLLLDAAGVHQHHPVGDLEGLLLVVGDEDAGHVQLVVEPAEPAAQLLAHPGVQGAEGLVEEQHLGPGGERPGQGHALPLAAGELVRVAPGQPLELHQREQLLHPRLHLGPGALADPERKGDVVPHGHVAEEGVVLEHQPHVPVAGAPAVDGRAAVADLAGVRGLEAREDAQERGLAAAGGAEERGQLALGQGQAHVLEHGVLPEALAHVGDLDGHGVSERVTVAAPPGRRPAKRAGVEGRSRRCCHSMSFLARSVTSASRKRSEATAKAARKAYSL